VTTTETNPSLAATLGPYDGVLLLSFGGPEGPDDVLPFLRNVTAGRGIPDERLTEVAEHYHHFGGRSPINAQNRALVTVLHAELHARGVRVPVLWGNRNWDPYLTDALRDAYDQGHRRIVVVPTSGYSSYSGCRQYREDIAAAVLTLAGEGRLLVVDKIRPFANHPGFVDQGKRAAMMALLSLPVGSHLAFVTHSIPTAMDDASGPPETTGAYSRQHRDVAATIAAWVSERLYGDGRQIPWELVYCSRSGPPTQPWLEPDIGDHLRSLAGTAPGVAVCPIGFVSDHLEVAFDLDTEAAEIAAEVGLPFARADTAGVDPVFVAMVADLLSERAEQALGDQAEQPTVGSLPATPAPCPVGCCRNLRAAKPAAAGLDWPEISAQLLSELVALAESAARAAGELIHGQRPALVTVADTKSSPTDVVTEMDRRSEQLLHELLLAARPGDGILGEEGASQPSQSGITWVVDPIDGTVNYLYDLPSYCVSIGAVVGDPTVPGAYRALVGVVFNPGTGECYSAVLGQGATVSGQPLRGSACVELSQALLATGFGYDRGDRARQGQQTALILPQVRDIRRLGSAALDLCRVAAGTVDGYYEQGLKPWDLVAAELIATEAGVLVTGVDGRPAGPDFVVAAGPGLQPQLVDLVARTRSTSDAV
jgi:protoporphyrin/coproporphyrin ferrochelatase